MTATFVITTLLILLSPFLLIAALRLTAKATGSLLSARSAGRKALLQSLTSDHYSVKPSREAEDDPEWETVERHVVGTASNGGTEENGWSGVVGFFHPFW
jgi:hypothetical protein